MRLTKRQLKRIIREEYSKINRRTSINEGSDPLGSDYEEIEDLWNQIIGIMAARFPSVDTSYYGDKIFAAIENEFAAAADEDARSGMSKEQIRMRGM